MESERMSASSNKEIENLLNHDSAKTIQVAIHNKNSFDRQIAGKEIIAKNEENKQCLEKEISPDIRRPLDNYDFNIWRNKRITFSKSLFNFRVSQFLWFGGGRLPSFFLGVFLKQHGVSLIELSSIYSCVFLVQFTSCSITGLIADKIGNAKPIVIFLMVSTSAILLSLSFLPSINTESCIQNRNDLNFSENNKYISFCVKDCFPNFTDINFMYENLTFYEYFDQLVDETNISNLSDFANNSHYVTNSCWYQCFNNTNADCLIKRKEHLVIVYAVLVLSFFSVWSTTYRFLDFTALSLAVKNDSDFGKERFVGNCGEFLIIIIAAYVLNIDKSSGSKVNYDLVIRIAASVTFLAFLPVCNIRFPVLPPGRNLMKKTFRLIRNIDILVFILLVFVAGNGFAFNSNFHLIFLETLNAPKSVIGLHTVTFSFYGFAILFTSKWWLKKLGLNKVFVLSLISYAVNNIVYSFLYNTWWSLILESTTVFSFHLFWVAAVVHSRRIAPEGLAATLNAVAGAIHFGIGRSSGVFIGGMLMNFVGPRKTYRIMATIYIVTSVLFIIFILKRHKSSVKGTRANDEEVGLKATENIDLQDIK